jgi:hypothetical protein
MDPSARSTATGWRDRAFDVFIRFVEDHPTITAVTVWTGIALLVSGSIYQCSTSSGGCDENLSPQAYDECASPNQDPPW